MYAPGWRRLVGFTAVMQSWQRIFENTFGMKFDITGVEISVSGDIAWVVCTENITSQTYDGPAQTQVEATNVFERHDGRWLVVHHHGSPVVSGPVSEEPPPHYRSSAREIDPAPRNPYKVGFDAAHCRAQPIRREGRPFRSSDDRAEPRFRF